MSNLIEITQLCRDYPMGDSVVKALRDVDLVIEGGEFVAIMGPSGSGKSTLMAILGCLDRPTGGRYLLNGQDVSSMSDVELSWVRNREVGFVFQQFNLLNDLDVVDNVAIGLVYNGVPRSQRRTVATELAGRLGLADRITHTPNELSGGQIQRVAIARALAGRPRLILADEPTGNLDSKTGKELLGVFDELHREGHSIIMVTHERSVAEHATRIITIGDGEIVSDERFERAAVEIERFERDDEDVGGASKVRFEDLLRIALREGLLAHKLRSILTMLGIVFGIAAVISMTAITEGGKKKQLAQIRQIGMNNIQVRDLGLEGSRLLRARVLSPKGINQEDLREIVRNIDGIEAATAWKGIKAELRHGGNVVEEATTLGITGDFQNVVNFYIGRGRFLNSGDEDMFMRVCVLGREVARKLDLGEDGTGAIIIIGDEPFEVIGIMQGKEFTSSDIKDVNIINRNMDVYIPYATLRTYFRKDLHASYMDVVSLRMKDDQRLLTQSKHIHRIIGSLHKGGEDYEVTVPLESLKQTQQTKEVFNIIIIIIAAISLVVGGIGIMNIMLANVTERTREIGIRRAVGASQMDILHQFLAEALLISLCGGVLGVIFGLVIGLVIEQIFSFPVAFNIVMMIVAAFVSIGIGLVFGIYPAWLAAKLNPVDALRA